MKKIYLGGAGGAPTNNVIKSLKESGDEHLIGASCVEYDLLLADVQEKYWVPPAKDPTYKSYLIKLLSQCQPDFAHFQNDFEIKEVSYIRDKITALGTKLFLPSHETILNCIDKSKSYNLWRSNGLTVPETILIDNTNDLKRAFEKLGEFIWIRAVEGAAGSGALPTDNYSFAKSWIDQFKGWGNFTAASLLTSNSITWLSLWFEGELVVAQTRKRRSWNFSNRSISGVTGITGVGETVSDDHTTKVALDAINSIDSRPHGLYGVDMTYDFDGIPNPTEINIGRFFTTVYFFTKAGLNLPRMYSDIALYGKFPTISPKINPLPDGLVWVRGMDREPVLTDKGSFDAFIKRAKIAK